MFFYRQFWKNLVQIANKPKQQLIEIIYIAVIQVFTPPPPQKKQTKSILLSAVVYSKIAAWLSSSKILCHAIKDFHSYQTNKTIFKFGKNNFISFGYQALL